MHNANLRERYISIIYYLLFELIQKTLHLFILFLVGVMLLSEGGHLAHLHFGPYAVEPMAKSTFYFVLIVLVIVDVAQGRYQKKLDLERAREQGGAA